MAKFSLIFLCLLVFWVGCGTAAPIPRASLSEDKCEVALTRVECQNRDSCEWDASEFPSCFPKVVEKERKKTSPPVTNSGEEKDAPFWPLQSVVGSLFEAFLEGTVSFLWELLLLIIIFIKRKKIWQGLKGIKGILDRSKINRMLQTDWGLD